MTLRRIHSLVVCGLLLAIGLPAAAQPTLTTANITANGQSVAVNAAVGGLPSVGIDISGTFTGTLTFQESGTSTCSSPRTITALNATLSTTTTATSAGLFVIPNAGYRFVCVTSTSWTSGTATVAITRGYLAPPLIEAAANLDKVGGTATVTGGVAGSQGVGGTAGNDAAIAQNPLLVGVETVAAGSTPTAATAGNLRRMVGDVAGNQYSVAPAQWTCKLQALAATLTECQAAAPAGYSLYLTSVIATTTTGTAGTFALRSGTGTNCGTTTTGVWPQPGGASPTRTVTAPITTAAPMQWNFGTGLKLTAQHALCVIGTTTNTIDITVTGYIAP